MKSKQFFIFFLLFFLFPVPSRAGLTDPKLKWFTLETKHFNIHYYEGEEEAAYRMAVITEKVFNELSPKFRWKPWGRTEVVLANTTDVSNGLTTTLPYNFILLLIAPPQGDSSLNYYDNWLEDLFRHEYTHTLHLDMVGGPVWPLRFILGRTVTPNAATPGWIREGLPTMVESLTGKGRVNNSFSEMMLRTDILNDHFLRIDEMDGHIFKWPSFNAAYIYGGMFLAYLADTYGQDKIVDFVKNYSSSLWFLGLNTSSKKVFAGKNFYRLKNEWEARLKEKYFKEKNQLETQGLTPLQLIISINDGTLDSPTLSRDGKYLLYVHHDYFHRPTTRLLNLETGKDEKLSKEIGNQYSFSPDGKKVAFSRMAKYKHWYNYFDLYELDLETKKSKRLTKGLRAFHPDYSPDGKKIVYVANDLTTTQLFLWDLEDEKATPLTPLQQAVQYSNPRFSPDGTRIAVSRWKHGKRDIVILDLKGQTLTQVTDDEAIDNNPIFSPDGNNLYFSSDRTGITNIYRYDLRKGTREKITNVLTGLFEPQIAAHRVLVKHYNGHGYDIQAFGISESFPATPGAAVLFPTPEETAEFTDMAPDRLPDLNLTPKKYNPFKKLFIPRAVLPGFFFTDDTVLLSATLNGRDPLARHIWQGGITYRFDANFLGGNFLYSYNRFWPSLFVRFADFVVSYGDLFRIGSTFFEERTAAGIGASLSGYARGKHTLTGYYFFENRSAEGIIPAGATDVPTLGKMSGFGLHYQFNRAVKNPGDISLEEGPRLILDFQASDSALGSSQNLEQIIFQGDLREYVPLPWKGHVLALRAAGGIAFGDRLLQGTFRLGSATGESLISGPTPRLFTLRGLPQITFAGERAMLFSGEYRLPLIYPDRGAGTGPIFLQKLHMAFFADYGSVFNGDIDFGNFLLGVGSELRADLLLFYGLPLTARLGYGIIVVGRQFIQGLTDPITGAALSNGTLILELGTSF